MAEKSKKDESSEQQSGWSELLDSLPLDELKNNVTDYVSAWGEQTITGLGDKVSGFIEQLGSGEGSMGKAAAKGAEKLAEGDSPLKAGLSGAATGVKEQVKDVFTGGSSGGGKKQKVTNIVEYVDVGVPVSVAYNQWTQFQDWSDFMKKVENVDQQSDEKISFKGQVFWSHRTWDSTIIQQVPDEQIVWRSTGQKGHLDGGVTFHELAPRLTRIIAVVEYYPQGFMEKTGNIWRAVGRRVQVEFKRYVRQVMTSTILDPDSVEGWRGEIRDSEVVRTHEEVVEEEQAQQEATDEQAEQDTDQEDTQASEDTGELSEESDEELGEDEPVDDQEPEADEATEQDEYSDEPVEEDAPEDEEPLEEEEPVEDEPVDEEEPPAENEAEEPADDEPVEEEPTEEEPVEEEPVDEEEPPAEDEAEEPADDEPVEEESAEEEPVEEEPAEEEPVEEEPAEAEEEPAEEEKPARKSGGRSSNTAKSGARSKSSQSSKNTSKGSKTSRSTTKRKPQKRS